MWWSDVVAVAEAAVPAAHAERIGKRPRAAGRKWNTTRYRNHSRLTDEERGRRFVARRSLAQAVRDGIIERAGNWCRLAHDLQPPPTRWMEGSILPSGRPTPRSPALRAQ